ncbi:MAG: CehA/McbA family metallohydrolase [Candidatus Neomarinimicrobiota bacterium]
MLLAPPSLWPDLAWLLSAGLLYAEMHYRWWPLPSRYFRRQPEILADAPYRVEPGRPIPLLLLVKDAHRYPITLERAELRLETAGELQTLDDIPIDEDIADAWWHRTVMLERPQGSGDVNLWVTFHYTVRGRSRRCTSHNLRSLKPRPLTVHLASDPLPGAGVVWGDLHTHSDLTDDMIEFGAPLEATREAASAVGLGFVCVTDHSYDLDDLPGHWRKSDPELGKWRRSRRDMAALNGHREGGALIVPGEEVSVRNTIDRNVHALVLGHLDFLPGSGDGGERVFHRRSELNVAELVEALGGGDPQPATSPLVMAAHPYNPVPFLQWAAIKRGTWQDRDARQPGIAGLQILNGRLDEGFFHGVDVWVEMLLQGHRKFIYAGSDAHGDFNLHRQIRLLFMSLWERGGHVMGACRTGVLGAPPGDVNALLAALAAGRCIISNGPFLNLTATSDGKTAAIGETLAGRVVQVDLSLRSSEEFGPLAGFRLVHGRVGAASEETVAEEPVEGRRYESSWTGSVAAGPGTSYLRAEVETWPAKQRSGDDGELDGRGLAMTNPIWLEGG